MAAVTSVLPIPPDAWLSQEELSEIHQIVDHLHSGNKIGWLPDKQASRQSDKIDRTKCEPTVVKELPPEVFTRLLAEFPDVSAELLNGLLKSRPTDHPIMGDETQTPTCPLGVPIADNR